MILSALVIFAMLGTAYMWGARGMFSALVHMLCTIIAGAIAFAMWEPMTGVFMDMMGGDLVDYAHGLALGLPFAFILIVLRLATNAILPKNVDLDGITNMVGGGVCGLISGVLTTGIFVIAVGYLRFEDTLMGYGPMTYDNSGCLVRTSNLLAPVDRITASFYGKMSETTLRTDENLAKWHPNLADEAPLLRMNYDDGKSRHVNKPGSFEVTPAYTLESAKGGLFNDSFNDQKKRSYKYLNGDVAADAQTYLAAYTVKFRPSANEKGGTVIVGPSQVAIIAQKEDGTTMQIQPAAVISEAKPPEKVKKGEEGIHLKGRWAFDAPKPFISTVGGRNESPMTFEFPVPKGATPIGIVVKGNRAELAPGATGAKLNSTAQRDDLVRTGTNAVTVKIDASAAFKAKGPLVAPNMVMANNIPGNIIFQKDDLRGLNIDDSKHLTDGEGKFLEKDIQGRNSEPALQVRTIACPEDQVIVQVVVDGRNPDWGFVSSIGQGMDMDKAPVLADESGTAYTAFGYVYKTAGEVWMSLRPDAPFSKVSDLPVLTRSKPNDQLVLLFRVGKNQKIKYFAVGERALLDMTPPFETNR